MARSLSCGFQPDEASLAFAERCILGEVGGDIFVIADDEPSALRRLLDRAENPPPRTKFLPRRNTARARKMEARSSNAVGAFPLVPEPSQAKSKSKKGQEATATGRSVDQMVPLMPKPPSTPKSDASRRSRSSPFTRGALVESRTKTIRNLDDIFPLTPKPPSVPKGETRPVRKASAL